MNKFSKVIGLVFIGISLVACKEDKAVQDTVETEIVVQEEEVIEEGTWQNLYELEPAILKSSEGILKVDGGKAISLMDEGSRIKVSPTALELVLDALKTTSAKDYLSEEFNQAIIDNGGEGVGVRVDVSPNSTADGAKKRGNYYQFSIYENYADRIVTVGVYIFDVRTLSFYEMDVVEADYVPLKYAVDMKNTLAKIVQN